MGEQRGDKCKLHVINLSVYLWGSALWNVCSTGLKEPRLTQSKRYVDHLPLGVQRSSSQGHCVAQRY